MLEFITGTDISDDSDDDNEDEYDEALNLSHNISNILNNIEQDHHNSLQQRSRQDQLSRLRSHLTEQRRVVNRLEILKEALINQNEM